MKIIYTLIFFTLTTSFLTAQTSVNFSSGEGYVNGLLSNNTNWGGNYFYINTANEKVSTQSNGAEAFWGEKLTTITGSTVTFEVDLSFNGDFSHTSNQLMAQVGFNAEGASSSGGSVRDWIYLTYNNFNGFIKITNRNNVNFSIPVKVLDNWKGSSLTAKVSFTIGTSAATSFVSARLFNNTTGESTDIGSYGNGTAPAVRDAVYNAAVAGNVYGFFKTVTLQDSDATTTENFAVSRVELISENTLSSNTFNNSSTDNQWGNASNWSLGFVPTVNTSVSIPNTMTVNIGPSSAKAALANTLTIDSGGSLTTASNSSINVLGNVTNNGTLIMQSSSSSSSALMADSSSGSGTYKYEKYIAAFDDTNDLISAPFTGEVFSNLISNNSSVIYTNPNDNTQYLFGPFDNNSGEYLIYDSDTDGAETMSVAKGFKVGAVSGGANLVFTGAFQTANQTADIDVGSDATFNKWNLIGNPFPSYLDLSHFFNDNYLKFDSSYAALYAYDGDASDGSIWTIYNASNFSGVKIAPGQAFFIAADGSESLSFDTDMQTVSGGDDFISRSTKQPDSHIKLIMSRGDQIAQTDVYLNSSASNGIDVGYDAGLFANSTSDFDLYSALADSSSPSLKLAIQAISTDISQTINIPLGVVLDQGTNYSITIDDPSLLESVNVYLKDYETGALSLLNNGSYNFEVSSSLEGTSRFELRLTNSTLSNETLFALSNFKAINQDDTVLFVGDFQKNDQIKIFDMLGRLAMTHTIVRNEEQFKIFKNKLVSGLYVAQITRLGSSHALKFIKN
jgi:hypothetical protein